MVGEIGDDDGLARVAEYTRGGDKLHMAYCFDFLGDLHSAPFLHGVLERFNAVVGDGWPAGRCPTTTTRVATRWGGAQPDARLLRLAAAFQASLRGTICPYQGEELGLPEAELASRTCRTLRHRCGRCSTGRDGCRTPMPWRQWSRTRASARRGAAGAGCPRCRWRSTSRRTRRQPAGTFTQLLHWRRQQPALLHTAA